MLQIGFLILVALLGISEHEAAETVYITTAQGIKNQGYVAEEHHVVTTDGYILGMQRIPYARNKTSSPANRPVVFLMHGMSAASSAYIIIGNEYSPAYNLADAGFDVWMGNARGTTDSRKHVALDPDGQVRQFFDFSWEEIALYDITAMVDYILEHTGQSKLHYIGHSQGGTTFLVLNSMRPEYNKKFASAHLLAGVGYQEYFPDESLRNLAILTDLIYNLAVTMGTIELNPETMESVNNPLALAMSLHNNFTNACMGVLRNTGVCSLLGIKVNSSSQTDNIGGRDLESTGELNAFGGGSLKQVAHYGQNIRDKLFRRWKYGLASQNTAAYGTAEPPLYDLSLITTNTTMHYSLSDDLLDERDVLAMVAVMPNTVARKVARGSFLHEDYLAATDAKELVTDYVIQAIKDVEAQQAAESGAGGEAESEAGGEAESEAGGEAESEAGSEAENETDSNEDTAQSIETSTDDPVAEPIVATPLPGAASGVHLSMLVKLFLVPVILQSFRSF